MTIQVVTETSTLASVCAALRAQPFVAVDTEFMRESTYWPILCLVQLAGGDVEAVVDPLANGLDLTPLHELLTDDRVVKVFHAARQDVEIFWHQGGAMPKPLFDTQVAAMVCGFGDAVSYENLVRQLLGEQVDKSSRFTDWSRRPLSDRQLAYALSDVTHLRDLYPQLLERIEGQGRQAWVAEEMEALADPATYDIRPENAWRRLKLRGPKPKKLAVAISLAAWREREAQDRDVPRGRILKDDALIEVAQQAPTTPEELGRLRSVPKGFERSRSAGDVLAAVSAGLETPRDALPKLEDPNAAARPSPAMVDILKVVLRAQCEAHDVAPKLIANVADLERIAAGDGADLPAMKGWRRRIFGDVALDVLEGRVGLKVVDGAVVAAPL